jgi:hypothetical protein
MIYSKRLVSLRVQTLIANTTTTSLFRIHPQVLLLGDTESVLSVLYDTTRLTCTIESTCASILLVELGVRFLCITLLAGYCECPVSSLCTFARIARSWLRIALQQGFPEFTGCLKSAQYIVKQTYRRG